MTNPNGSVVLTPEEVKLVRNAINDHGWEYGCANRTWDFVPLAKKLGGMDGFLGLYERDYYEEVVASLFRLFWFTVGAVA